MNELSSRFTPINDAAPSCDETWASLCIYNIDPDLVTNKLGIKPTGGQKKGVPSIVPSGKEIIGRINSWVLSSHNYVTSKDIRAHLDWVLDKIEPVIPVLKELQRLPNVQMVIRCVWWSAESDGGRLTLWPEQMGRMAEANLEFSLSISYYGDDAEETDIEQTI